MHTRRNFLTTGGLATAALLTLKPFTSLSEILSPLTGTDGNYGKLLFLHTADSKTTGTEKAFRFIKKIKNNNPNVLLLDAGSENKDNINRIAFDASVPGTDELTYNSEDYKIVHKGDYKTGIISVVPGEKNIVEKVNRLSAFLKKEKKCTLVVCMSQVGFKHKNKIDDLGIARESVHLDIIIGGHKKNFKTEPFIALNSKNEEVIIHSASAEKLGCGLVEIGFDKQGRKKQVGFTG